VAINLPTKRVLSDRRVANISKSFTHKMARKPAGIDTGIDMERNYVTVALCVMLSFKRLNARMP